MRKALIVDDNRQIADSLAQMLTLFDFETQTAYGARAGLNALRSITPSVVFLDLNMPGLTGFDVLSYLKREPRLSKVPVIVVTSDDQPESAERAMQSGATAYVIKPASMDIIESTLQSLGLV